MTHSQTSRFDEERDRPSVALRAATSDDLPQLFRLTLEGLEGSDLVSRVSESSAHAFHEHALDHGRIVVAESDGTIQGYATTIERDGTLLLSQLFVRSDAQSVGVGSILLKTIDPATNGVDRGVIASGDLRATALYIRHGYVPVWPHYTLNVPSSVVVAESQSDALETAVADRGTDLEGWDQSVCGRHRSQDHRYWADAAGGVAYWFLRAGNVAGYGWIMDPLSGRMADWYKEAAPLQLGPVGAESANDARECVLAALNLIKEKFPGRGIIVEIGGPHPALPDLLSAGARIENTETAMFTNAARFGVSQCYLPSGGVLY